MQQMPSLDFRCADSIWYCLQQKEVPLQSQAPFRNFTQTKHPNPEKPGTEAPEELHRPIYEQQIQEAIRNLYHLLHYNQSHSTSHNPRHPDSLRHTPMSNPLPKNINAHIAAIKFTAEVMGFDPEITNYNRLYRVMPPKNPNNPSTAHPTGMDLVELHYRVLRQDDAVGSYAHSIPWVPAGIRVYCLTCPKV